MNVTVKTKVTSSKGNILRSRSRSQSDVLYSIDKIRLSLNYIS